MENNQKKKVNYTFIVLCVFILISAILLLSIKSNNQTEPPKVAADQLSVNDIHSEQIKSNETLDLQKKCADQAYLYYQHNVDKSSKESTDTYSNHFSKKLNKCFIEITTNIYNDNGLFIDVYDAYEGKRYATYLGCNIYDNSNKCKLSSGDIWFDGNDTRYPADFHIGFEGLSNGPGVADENTLKAFTDEVGKFLMNN